MDAKKTVLFLINGFGIEAPKSFGIYNQSLMPNLDQISHECIFKSIFSSDEIAGLNKKQESNFESGYLAFSTFGHINRKTEVVSKSLSNGSFNTNPVFIEAISHAVNNQSRLHVFLPIGDRYTDDVFKQIRAFCKLCVASGLKEIFFHLFLGYNNNYNMQVALSVVKNFTYQITNQMSQVKVVAVASDRYIKNAPISDKKSLYRMLVSGVGEIWTDYTSTIETKYRQDQTDNNMVPFLVTRENIIRQNDSVFIFNYESNIAADYIDIIINSTNYFPVGKVPTNVRVTSLFRIQDVPLVHGAFEEVLPDKYFLEKIPESKKVLVIADKTRINYINNCLNGFRPTFPSNFSVIPLEFDKNRFAILTDYTIAYMEQGLYDLIIVDYSLYEEGKDKSMVDQLKRNMSDIDKCIGKVFNKAVEKDNTLIITSLYGLKQRLSLVELTQVNVNMSEKTPFIIMKNDIDRAEYNINPEASIADLGSLVYKELGISDTSRMLVSRKGQNRLLNILILVAVLIMAVLAYLYIFYM